MTNPFEGRRVLALPRQSSRGLRATIIAVVALVIVVPVIATRLADWLWYIDVGFERVFITKIVAQWILGLAAGIGGFLILYNKASIVMRGLAKRNLHIHDA